MAIFPSYALGMLILNSMPSAMYSGTMSDIAGGSIERAFSGTIYTSLICPLTIPLMIHVFIGEQIEPHIIWSKVQFLGLLIFIPFVLAGLTKKVFGETVKRYSSS
jgi:predicted Na+-dependent transporter